MDLFVAELYDYSFSEPMLVGIYDSEEKAETAITIVLRRFRENNPNDPEERFVRIVNCVQLNGFCPAVMDALGWEGV